MNDPMVCRAEAGRIRLCLTSHFQGEDLVVTLHGGDRPHIGAVALARPGAPAEHLELPGHREGPLAERLAREMAEALELRVSLTCGIHLDAILPEEIQAVQAMAEELAREMIRSLRAR
jgi:hypothetical protein